VAASFTVSAPEAASVDEFSPTARAGFVAAHANRVSLAELKNREGLATATESQAKLLKTRNRASHQGDHGRLFFARLGGPGLDLGHNSAAEYAAVDDFVMVLEHAKPSKPRVATIARARDRAHVAGNRRRPI